MINITHNTTIRLSADIITILYKSIFSFSFSISSVLYLCIILIIMSVKMLKRRKNIKLTQKEEVKISREDPRNKKED